MNILHIEQSRSIAQLVDVAAKELGLQLHHVDNYVKAIAIIKDQPFDLVLACRSIDNRNSFDFCARFRQYHQLTPFLVYASDINHKLQEEAATSGVTEIFPKMDLLDKLQDFVAAEKAQHEKISGNVLVVEDSPSQREFLTRLLQKEGLNVDSCDSVEQALTLVAKTLYNVIVADVFLSNEYSAFDLVTQVKRLPLPHSLAFFIAISGADDPARRLDLLNRGIDMFVPKPIKEQEFAATIRSFVIKSHKLLEYKGVVNTEPSEEKPKQLLKVHYIEDNRVLQILMKTFLQGMNGVEFGCSSTAAEGIDNIHSVQPDLLLLDLNLPDADGWELATRIRGLDLAKVPKIVAVTGEIMNAEKDEKAKELFDGFMSKPFVQAKLIELVTQFQNNMS